MSLRVRNAIARVVRDLLFPPSRLDADVQSSEERGEPVVSWWDRHHTQRAKFWISGSKPTRVWSLLNVIDRIKSGACVLDIGVGTGNAARKLHSLGCTVDALDISEAALRTVAAVTAHQFLPKSLARIPPSRYDLAVSFLVAQHMSDADLREQLQHVITALKPDGLLAIQIAFPTGAVTPDNPKNQKSGGVTRTPDQFSAMVEYGGGRIAWQQEIGNFPEYGSGWMAYHVVHK